MTTDKQVRKLMKLNQKEKRIGIAAAKAGMSENTARKYLRLGKLPSQCKGVRTWRTREDPFKEVWEVIKEKLETNPGLEAKTLFEWLQRENPGEYEDGQVRTLQRKIKYWRATEGPAKEVYFDQIHIPGQLSESDFTDMTKLGITIQGEPFEHLLYHFVLTYSNWETGTICFSESFESLSVGLQNALWQLGGVPACHKTDRLSAAVHNLGKAQGTFTDRYNALLRHYGLEGFKIRAREAHENGDVEQRHHRLKRAVEQSLLLQGSRDFDSRGEYERFLEKLFSQLNAGRKSRFEEELKVLKGLPELRLEDYSEYQVRVRPSSTIGVKKNVYSVHSRLIGEWVRVRVYADNLEIRYAQKLVEVLPRLMGTGKYRIDYRHIIDWLIRKPGAFEHYRYREELFPTSNFRMAYDQLKERSAKRGHKEYLKILSLAAKDGESGVDNALRWLLDEGKEISAAACEGILRADGAIPQAKDIEVGRIDLCLYDTLLGSVEVGL